MVLEGGGIGICTHLLMGEGMGMGMGTSHDPALKKRKRP